MSAFLTRVYRSGALFGAPEALYVKCDAETNPPELIEAGQVVCEIGIAPVKPAEFVIFRLSQFTGGAGEAGRSPSSNPGAQSIPDKKERGCDRGLDATRQFKLSPYQVCQHPGNIDFRC